MYVTSRFTEETRHSKSPWTKQNVLSHIYFVPLELIPTIKICHMFAIEHPEVIARRWRLIATDFPDYEEAYEDGSIDDDGAASDEED